MRWIVFGSFSCLVAFASCGGKSREAQSANDADEKASSDPDEKPLTDKEKAARRAERASEVDSAKGESDSKATPCRGARIDDLVAVLSKSACIVANGNVDGKQADVSDVLEVKATPDAARVAPGATTKISVVFRNKGRADLPLDFMVDPEPRFDFELYTAKGKRADQPKGNEPALPPEVANAPAADKQIARITLPPQGTARVILSWEAVKFKWAAKSKARGAVAGHGYPREAAGPLPKGKYVLRVLTPLVNVFDGADHDVSQPRAAVEVGLP